MVPLLLPGPWRYFLEPVKSLWQLWQLCVSFLTKGDRKAKVIYSWPSGQAYWPKLKPSKEVVSGVFLFVFIRLMWKPLWLGISILMEGKCYILTVRGKMSLFCEGKNEVFFIELDVTFHGTRGDSLPGKYCKIARGRNSWLLCEIHFLFLKTLETHCKSLLVWPQQLDCLKLQYFSGLYLDLFVCLFVFHW